MELKVEIEALEAGFDPARLQRIGARLRRYVDDGLLPGWTFVLAHDGQVVLVETCGQRDIEAGAPIELDTIFRAYSMTKPITAVAALMLWEEGAFELKDPVSRYVPSFADRASGGAARSSSRSPTRSWSRWRSGTSSPTRAG